MPDIIKTWPAFMEPRKVLRIFTIQPPWTRYYFSMGRGKPQKAIEFLWLTFRGRILGKVQVEELVRNDGSLPRLRRLDGGESDWQFKDDMWVAICFASMERLREHLYYQGFRGWRYFDLDQYRQTPAARWNF